jgi:hypothetical protein
VKPVGIIVGGEIIGLAVQSFSQVIQPEAT